MIKSEEYPSMTNSNLVECESEACMCKTLF